MFSGNYKPICGYIFIASNYGVGVQPMGFNLNVLVLSSHSAERCKKFALFAYGCDDSFDC